MKKTKIAILGANGQIGKALLKDLSKSFEIFPFGKNDCDLSHISSIDRELLKCSPDIVINCSAYTDVKKAEIDRENCYKLNCINTQNLVDSLKNKKLMLIHFSTDYIFSNKNKDPVNEENETHPVNYYGTTKLESEKIVRKNLDRFYIFRTSWVYGDSLKDNFVEFVKKSLLKNKKIQALNSEYSIPTNTGFISKTIEKIISHSNFYNASGIYNLVPDGYCNRYECARFIEKKLKGDNLNSLININYKSQKKDVPRPNFSVLSNAKIKDEFKLDVKDWKIYLEEYLRNENK